MKRWIRNCIEVKRWTRIRIEVKSWILIRIEVNRWIRIPIEVKRWIRLTLKNDADPQNPGCVILSDSCVSFRALQRRAMKRKAESSRGENTKPGLGGGPAGDSVGNLVLLEKR